MYVNKITLTVQSQQQLSPQSLHSLIQVSKMSQFHSDQESNTLGQEKKDKKIN